MIQLCCLHHNEARLCVRACARAHVCPALAVSSNSTAFLSLTFFNQELWTIIVKKYLKLSEDYNHITVKLLSSETYLCINHGVYLRCTDIFYKADRNLVWENQKIGDLIRDNGPQSSAESKWQITKVIQKQTHHLNLFLNSFKIFSICNLHNLISRQDLLIPTELFWSNIRYTKFWTKNMTFLSLKIPILKPENIPKPTFLTILAKTARNCLNTKMV